MRRARKKSRLLGLNRRGAQPPIWVMQMENIVRIDKVKSRAIIVRCSDSAFMSLLELIKGYPDCFLVFTKTSPLRLVVVEEGWT